MLHYINIRITLGKSLGILMDMNAAALGISLYASSVSVILFVLVRCSQYTYTKGKGTWQRSHREGVADYYKL